MIWLGLFPVAEVTSENIGTLIGSMKFYRSVFVSINLPSRLNDMSAQKTAPK